MNRIDHLEILTTLSNPHWEAEMNFQAMNAQAIAFSKMNEKQLEEEENKIIERRLKDGLRKQKRAKNLELVIAYSKLLDELHAVGRNL